MACNKNYNFVLDLSNVPKKEGTNLFDWKNSIGCIVNFSSDNFCGKLEIIEYIPKHIISDNSYLIVKYENDILSPITVQGFKNGKLSRILQKYLFEWKYEIGDIVIDENKNMTIIDRKYDNGIQYYKIKCNKCGFDCGEHYYNQVFKEEMWISIYNLNKAKGCPCCGRSSKIVVSGINDIPTTAPWMIKYFQGGYNEAKMYTQYSNNKLFFICPYCNRVSDKKIPIHNLRKYFGLSCICNDKMSFPNKFIYFLFEQIKDNIDYFEKEYQPEWAKPYRYDLFFIIKNKKYIVEMDGGVGHGNKKFKSQEIDREGLERDKVKDKLAFDNNITVIRIDCLKSDFEYIKNNVLNSLINIIDLSNVNWKKLEEYCTSNIVKEICEYYNRTHDTILNISNVFKTSTRSIIDNLEKGNRLGWCNYIKINKTKENNIKKCIDYINNDPNCTVNELSNGTGLSYCTVNKYLHQLEYEEFLKNSKEKGYKESSKRMTEKNSKIVYVYDLKLKFLGKYCSENEIERISLKDFGVILKSRAISRVCTGERKQYKGFIFSHTKLHND